MSRHVTRLVMRAALVWLMCAICTHALSANNNIDNENEWIAELHTGENADEIARQHGMINKGNVAGLANVYLFVPAHLRSDTSSHQIGYGENGENGLVDGDQVRLVGADADVYPGKLHAHPGVKYASQQKSRVRIKRVHDPYSDPSYGKQWHLHGTPGADINVEPVWTELGYTGRGVTIAIVDDGVDHRHPDLAAHYSASGSHDFNARDEDPLPFAWDVHGTAAAGVAAAASNEYCGVGVAPDANIAGIRLIAQPCTDYEEAEALCFADAHTNDVYSSSWGPPDSGEGFAGPDYITGLAIE